LPGTGGYKQRSDSIHATLNYAVKSDRPLVYYASAGAEGQSRPEGDIDRRAVTIANGREWIAGLTLEDAGFALVQHRTAVSDFYSPAQVESIYEPEVEDLVRKLTGANRVVVFDHTLRTDSDRIREDRQVRDHVELVHNDYTEKSARQRIRDLMPAGEAAAIISRRFAILNVWRSVGGIVETTPLAMCDARSISDHDLVPVERRARDRIGEMQQGIFNPDHRWFYFPRMERNEALVFKTFDSSDDGRARWTLHSAFANPDAASDASPRESIETRAFAFF